MHVVFLLSVIAFTASTCTMLSRDHDDEWRGYQSTFFEIETLLGKRDETSALETAVSADDAAEAGRAYEREIQRLEISRDEVATQLEDSSVAYQIALSDVEESALAFDLKGREVRVERAQRDVARANYDLQIRDQSPPATAQAFFKKFQDAQAKVDALELELEELDTELTKRQEVLAGLTTGRDELQDELKTLTSEVVRIRESLDVIAPKGTLKATKRALMEKPIIDGFNSHMQLVQDWLPDLSITLGMASTARFDRCRTCHLGIDRYGAGDVPTFPHGDIDSDDPADWVAANAFPQPFSSHPRPDVYLTASSPHPLPEFGCTICHEGQGSATNFTNAQHGPNDPHQDEEWNEKHSHSYNHFWEYPMFPKRLRDAACLKCHHEVVELGENPDFGPTAPKAYRGWQLIKKYGCFGCHEINGFDGKDRIGPDLRLEPTAEEADKFASDPNLIPGTMRKVGPSLKRVADKTTAEWIAYWTEKPKRFRATTKMPQFFGLTNLEDHLGAQLSGLEVRAIAKFLVSQSTPQAESKTLMSPADGYAPDADRGKVAFAERGCLACHSHDGDDFKRASATFGPNLTKIGHKLRTGEAGFNWLYTWIRDPERHHPRTKMPNLFLDPVVGDDGTVTSDPAADIATFLIGSGDYPVAPLEMDVVQKELTKLLVASGKLGEADFEEFWSSKKYTHKAAWPETLLTEAEAGDLDWESVLSRYLKAVEYEALAQKHLVARDLMTAEEFDAFWKSRSYPKRSGKKAPVVWPESLLTKSAASDSEWADSVGTYLDSKAILELSRLNLAGKIITTDQFATMWGINWKGERKVAAQIKRIQGELKKLDAKSEEYPVVEKKLKAAQATLAEIKSGARKLPLSRKEIKGDEIELFADGEEAPTQEEFDNRMLNFLGRRSVSRYGCYACHDINGYGKARSIGTALQDWGRKDTSRLAPEHIHEYLHHHGRRDGSSTQQFVQDALDRASSGSFDSEEEREDALRTAFFYESLIHHGRPGFIFQKLRQPRSYDFKKIDTKRYNERLVMPMFPLEDDEIEAIATFVLGLVAEPQAAKYIYTPDQRTRDRNQGEILLKKYNCTGCHVIDMPEIEYAPDMESPLAATEIPAAAHKSAVKRLLEWRRPVDSHFGSFHTVNREDEEPNNLPTVRIKGLPFALPEPEDEPADQVYSFDTWEPVSIRGWLVSYLSRHRSAINADPLASQAGDFQPVYKVLNQFIDEATNSEELSISPTDVTQAAVAAEALAEVESLQEEENDSDSLKERKELARGKITRFSEVLAGLATQIRPGKDWDVLMPGSRLVVFGPSFVELSEGKGGSFAHWLVEDLTNRGTTKNRAESWQKSPPPLFKEGQKVQTDWLYRFLKNPEQIRYSTVLRMPQFNMSDEEARIFASYFAAAEKVEYPYQKQPQQLESYLAGQEAFFHREYPNRSAENSYREESWRMLATTICIKCHAVGGGAPAGKPDDPTVVRGPNLGRVHERLRPEWVSNWVFNPKWITTYTGMPAPFPANQTQYPRLFNGKPIDQTVGVRDALMNYPRLMEGMHKPLPPEPSGAPAAAE